MGLKYEVESLEGIDEAVKGMYKPAEGGKFRLDVDGIEDTSGLKRKVDELLTEKKTAAQKAKEAEEARKAAEFEAAKKAGDIAALENSYKEKIESLTGANRAELDGYRAMISDLTVGQTATRIAAELAVPGSADVLLPHIKGRLSVETVDGKASLRVLDKDGKPSAATVEDLKKEFVGNPAFAPLISGSRASGAGHQGSGTGGGAPGKKFNELTGGELKELRAKDPQAYERLRKEFLTN